MQQYKKIHNLSTNAESIRKNFRGWPDLMTGNYAYKGRPLTLGNQTTNYSYVWDI